MTSAGIEQQARLAERDAAQVLHGAEGEVGERDEIAFLAGIRDPVVVGEELDRELADVERELGQVAASGHVRDADLDAACVDRLGHLERADDPCDEIRRHRDRCAESDADVAVGEFLAVDLRTVREREQPVGDDESDREGRLELGLVEARERGAGVRRLELGRGEDAVGAGLVDERAAVEAEEPVADLAVELQLQHCVTGRQGLLRGDDDLLALGVDRQRGGDRDTTLPELDEGDLEALGVEDDGVGRLRELERDHHLTAERRCLEIRGDQQLVAAGTSGEGESTGLFHRGRSVGPARSFSGVVDCDRYTRSPRRTTHPATRLPGGGPQRGRKRCRQPKQTT